MTSAEAILTTTWLTQRDVCVIRMEDVTLRLTILSCSWLRDLTKLATMMEIAVTKFLPTGLTLCKVRS